MIVGNFFIPTLNLVLGTQIENYMQLSFYVAYVLLGYIIGGGLHDEDNDKVKNLIDVYATVVGYGLDCGYLLL